MKRVSGSNLYEFSKDGLDLRLVRKTVDPTSKGLTQSSSFRVYSTKDDTRVGADVAVCNGYFFVLTGGRLLVFSERDPSQSKAEILAGGNVVVAYSLHPDQTYLIATICRISGKISYFKFSQSGSLGEVQAQPWLSQGRPSTFRDAFFTDYGDLVIAHKDGVETIKIPSGDLSRASLSWRGLTTVSYSTLFLTRSSREITCAAPAGPSRIAVGTSTGEIILVKRFETGQTVIDESYDAIYSIVYSSSKDLLYALTDNGIQVYSGTPERNKNFVERDGHRYGSKYTHIKKGIACTGKEGDLILLRSGSIEVLTDTNTQRIILEESNQQCNWPLFVLSILMIILIVFIIVCIYFIFLSLEILLR